MVFPAEIDVWPAEYVDGLGVVFARFDGNTQDSGNVSYGVQTLAGRRYFVKTAGDPADQAPYLDFDGRVTLLRNAVRLAEAVPYPLLPELHAVIESPGGPVLVYEWREGEHLGTVRERREDPDTAYQRFRALPAEQILETLDELFDLHSRLTSAGWVEGDFYDGCLLYDFGAQRLTVMDLDTYHFGAYRNEMGRMFGASRFMAPEEFSLGAPIDERTTTFVMGRTVFVFLADGTLEREAFRGTDALYFVVQEAVTTRFPSYDAFYQAWLAARQTI